MNPIAHGRIVLKAKNEKENGVERRLSAFKT